MPLSPAMPLPLRQVHLDFHTSPDVPDVGADFDPDRFAGTLADAGVDSITCFARCHHGLLYYPSRKHADRIHPHLVRPKLLNEQIEACHARGIRVPVYTTVQWDHLSAMRNPEWLCTDAKGAPYGGSTLTPGFYQNLDVFHPGYRGFLQEHLRDLFACLPDVDGVFLDITKARASCAPHWIEAMTQAGLDPQDETVRATFARQVMDDWMLETADFIRELGGADCGIFFNNGHVGPAARPAADAYSHWELESLPSGGWGYLHFPLAMHYARTLANKPCLGMTGKFHTSWGDFHSYKGEVALEFECLRTVALGAAVSVGDQLPPRGELDKATYDLLKPTFTKVKAVEPWFRNATPVTEIAILTPEALARPSVGSDVHSEHERSQTNAMGALMLLDELGHQYDIVDGADGFDGYRVLILPDVGVLTPELAAKIDAFADAGGKLLVTAEAGVDASGASFALQSISVDRVGPAKVMPQFLVPSDTLGGDLPRTPHAMYLRGVDVTPKADAEVLLEAELPYFERTWQHFFGHQHAPSDGRRVPAVVANDRCVYLTHPHFAQYRKNAPAWCKSIVRDVLIRLLAGRQLVRHDGPSTLLTSLMRQEAEGRHVLHVLHYVPQRRGEDFDTVPDRYSVRDVTMRLDATRVDATAAKLVPGDAAVDMTREDGELVLRLPVVEGHVAIELNKPNASSRL
jgi:hypothetical protein